jgi:hypothetical protein
MTLQEKTIDRLSNEFRAMRLARFITQHGLLNHEVHVKGEVVLLRGINLAHDDLRVVFQRDANDMEMQLTHFSFVEELEPFWRGNPEE